MIKVYNYWLRTEWSKTKLNWIQRSACWLVRVKPRQYCRFKGEITVSVEDMKKLQLNDIIIDGANRIKFVITHSNEMTNIFGIESVSQHPGTVLYPISEVAIESRAQEVSMTKKLSLYQKFRSNWKMLKARFATCSTISKRWSKNWYQSLFTSKAEPAEHIKAGELTTQGTQYLPIAPTDIKEIKKPYAAILELMIERMKEGDSATTEDLMGIYRKHIVKNRTYIQCVWSDQRGYLHGKVPFDELNEYHKNANFELWIKKALGTMVMNGLLIAIPNGYRLVKLKEHE